MSPKKAIIIITVLALLTIAIFAYLFNANKNYKQNNFLPTASNKVKSDQEIIIEKIAETTTKGEQAGKTKDEIREEVVNAVNNYILEIKQKQTPEEKALEEVKNREREKIIQEFNNSLKNK